MKRTHEGIPCGIISAMIIIAIGSLGACITDSLAHGDPSPWSPDHIMMYPSDCDSLQACIDYAAVGSGMVYVEPGTHRIQGSLYIRSGILIFGSSAQTTRLLLQSGCIDIRTAGRLAAIRGLSITGQQTQLHGAIVARSSYLSVSDCHIQGTGFYGGGICVLRSQALIDGCYITRCRATYGGGILADDSSRLIVSECKFILNNASSGASIYTEHSDSEIFDCDFLFNSAPCGGSVLSYWGGRHDLHRCRSAANTMPEIEDEQ